MKFRGLVKITWSLKSLKIVAYFFVTFFLKQNKKKRIVQPKQEKTNIAWKVRRFEHVRMLSTILNPIQTTILFQCPNL